MSKPKFFNRYFPLILIGGIVIGAIVGLIFKEKSAVVKPLGDIFLNLMFTIVVPLVFVSMATAVGNMVDMKRLGKILGSTVTIFILTGIIAAFFVLITVKVFPPAQGTQIVFDKATQMGTPKTAAELIVSSLTVPDFPDLISRRNMMPLIVFSILFGLAVSACGGAESAVGKFLNNLSDVIMKFVDMIMKFAPIGLGAYFANLIGEFGPGLIQGYGRALLVYYPLIVIYMLIMFPIYAYYSGGMEAVKRMSKSIMKPAITAFATQSSVATIPVNKKACDEIGVPSDVSNIVLPMGATMHMDGSVISGILKIAFLYGIFNMPFDGIGLFVKCVIVAILGGFVLSGVPGGGLVGEMLIVSMFGFPPEAFPIIATIGFLVDPPATMANSSGDTIASMMVTRVVEGRDWIKKKVSNS